MQHEVFGATYRRLLSFECFGQYGESSRSYGLTNYIQVWFNDSFLCVFSASTREVQVV